MSDETKDNVPANTRLIMPEETKVSAEVEANRARMVAPGKLIVATPDNKPANGEFVTFPRDVVSSYKIIV
jgi:hypothetical protein